MTTRWLLGLALLVAGCGHTLALTAAGTHVTKVDRGHLPDGCRIVGDVSIGIPPDAALATTELELTTLMRNKAANMGADHVVVETSDQTHENDGATHWMGSATAYVCTPVTEGGDSHEAPPEETTPAGGDAPPPI